MGYPPEHNAEFVACMEDVLEIYAQPYDSTPPVICMDEQPVQLIKKTRVPIEATLEHPKRADYEYERNGTASIFIFSEARAYVKRIEFVYTPKHGSWLNVAECELSALTRQCLTGRRIRELSGSFDAHVTA